MKYLYLVLPLLSLFFKGNTQTSTVSGYIRDAGSGETLIGATCYIPGLQTGGTSNQYGFYSLTLPRGTHKLDFTFVG